MTSPCIKVPRNKCRRMSKCLYANGSVRKYCRKASKHTCRGKSSSDCKKMPKCVYTRGSLHYCKKRGTRKHRK